MALDKGSAIVDWKKIWQEICGIYFEIPKENVKEILLKVSVEIHDGIFQFKEWDSQCNTLEKIVQSGEYEKLYQFVRRLQQFLDLESTQCWGLLCCYLVNEYKGSIQSLSHVVLTEANMNKLMQDIWRYYSIERMIALKVVNNLLQYHKSFKHPYHNEYKFILERITLRKLRKSYISQLEYLIKKGSPPNMLVMAETPNYYAHHVLWAESRMKEIREILHILILIIHFDGVNADEFTTMVDCFVAHNFGKQQLYLDSSSNLHNDLVGGVSYSEISLFILCLDSYQRNLPNNVWTSRAFVLLGKKMNQLSHNSEHGPMLLSWLLANCLKRSIECEAELRQYLPYGTRALQLGAFEYMFKMISHSMYKSQNLTSRLVRTCIYNIISQFCDLFNYDGTLTQCPCIYELLSEILLTPTISKDFCKNELKTGIRSLYSAAVERFPLDFIPLTMIAHSLCLAGYWQSKYIRTKLESLPIFCELHDSCKYLIKNTGEYDEELLIAEYTPFPGIDFKIRAGSTAFLIDRKNLTTIHFHTNLNYYSALHHEINLLLNDIAQYTEIDENRVNRVNYGLKYLFAVLQQLKSVEDISSDMVHPTELVVDVLNKMKILQCPPIELLGNCLNVCTSLLPFFEKEIVTRIINLNILPSVTNQALTFKQYANGDNFNSNLVGTYLINFEKNLEKYDFLIAYLKFLKKYTQMNKISNLFKVEIPGVMFLLREVFPHVHSWHFVCYKEKLEIVSITMQYFFEILQLTNDQIIECPSRRIIRDICVYSLLNLDNGISLIKYISLGNSTLESSMENEANWMAVGDNNLHFLVQISMTILMQLLRLKRTVFDNSELSPLEMVIYTQPKQRDAFRIIPVVTSYMKNIFNRRLPILACRLLRRFAIEFKMSLLACLDMKADQIRSTFLQCLKDELETDDLKIAVLDFVEACIHKQPCLTEAFFKVNYIKGRDYLAKRKGMVDFGDSVLTYMAEYLQAILKDTKYIESPLLGRIMSLFHALWKNNMQLLVHELMQEPNFWRSLCIPLFGDINDSIKVYGQLFNILGIEIFCFSENKVDSDLKKTINQFLNHHHFIIWVNHIFEIPKENQNTFSNEEIPEWLSRLQSFKDMMTILLRKKVDKIIFPEECQKILANRCLDVLVERANYTDDLRPFMILADFFLIIIVTIDSAFYEELATKMFKLLNCLTMYYGDINKKTKEACLAIAIKSLCYINENSNKNCGKIQSLLQPVLDILDYELTNLENNYKFNENIIHNTFLKENRSLILSLNLLKSLGNFFCTSRKLVSNATFIENRICDKMLPCLHLIIRSPSNRILSIELLEILIMLAKGNHAEVFLNLEFASDLWLKLLLPRDLERSYINQTVKENTWKAQDYWTVYSKGIKLVTVLLQQHKYYFLKDALSFIGIHEEYLKDSILLCKQSLDENVIALVRNTIELISEMVSYEEIWRLEHPQSLLSLTRCLQMLMHDCISSLHRPKFATSHIQEANVNHTSKSENLSTFFMNDLVEIIILGAKSLLRFSPGLRKLILEPENLVSKCHSLIDIEFGAPKLNAEAYRLLNFGVLLSAVGIFAKALTLQAMPLNILLPSSFFSCEQTSFQRPTSYTSFASNVALRPSFSKSLSATTVCSVNSAVQSQPSNEILTNLNGQFCLLALEHLLTLLASQSLLALKNLNLSNREKQLIRREISTELSIYHDLMRKRVLLEFRKMWQRRKFGIVAPVEIINFENVDILQITKVQKSSNHNSMRIAAVKRLHLQRNQKFIPKNGNTQNSEYIRNRRVPLDSLANISSIQEYSESEINEAYKNIVYTKFIEEDYLHFLSNLFTTVCQSN